MDEMRIKTPFIKKILNEIIKKALKKKVGCDVEVSIGEITIKNDGQLMSLYLDISAYCKTDNIPTILKNIGIIL